MSRQPKQAHIHVGTVADEQQLGSWKYAGERMENRPNNNELNRKRGYVAACFLPPGLELYLQYRTPFSLDLSVFRDSCTALAECSSVVICEAPAVLAHLQPPT